MPLTPFWREHSVRRIRHEVDLQHYDDATSVAKMLLWLEPDDQQTRRQILDLFLQEVETLAQLEEVQQATRLLNFSAGLSSSTDPRIASLSTLLERRDNKTSQTNLTKPRKSTQQLLDASLDELEDVEVDLLLNYLIDAGQSTGAFGLADLEKLDSPELKRQLVRFLRQRLQK